MEKKLKAIVKKAKDILFADPNLLYKEERQLVNQPFFFSGTNGKGVLLIHGWTSTPYEVRRLGKYLNENGYTVFGIQLKGHGTVPKDLEEVHWEDWEQDVKNGYGELKKTCNQVYIGGTSIGASLAIMFAAEQKEVSGLVLMATPYRFKLEPLVLLTARVMSWFVRYKKKVYPITFGLSTTITRLISYQTYPIKSALETFELVKASRKIIASVTQPCLIIQSAHDHIVTRDSVNRLYGEIGSAKKEKIVIERAYHTFISDIRNERIFKDILRFFEKN